MVNFRKGSGSGRAKAQTDGRSPNAQEVAELVSILKRKGVLTDAEANQITPAKDEPKKQA